MLDTCYCVNVRLQKLLEPTQPILSVRMSEAVKKLDTLVAEGSQLEAEDFSSFVRHLSDLAPRPPLIEDNEASLEPHQGPPQVGRLQDE